jgi:hypothetical protein
MIGGPVTAAPTMIMFWTIFRKKVFLLYMFVCIAGTIIISYAFQFLVFVPNVDAGNPLLRDVRSVSGGRSAVINKQNRHVRIVMEPGGKGIIATCKDELGGQGGIVFDSGFERFLNGSAERYDNQKYISNIAEWLEENSSSPDSNSILIYDTFTRNGLDKEAFSREALALLKGKGYRVRVTDRRETPQVSEEALGQYSQLWVLLGESGPGGYFSEAELQAISRFTGDGRSMLIVAGKRRDGANELAAANQLSSGFGVTFSGFVENKEELPVSVASQFLGRSSEVLGRILKLVHKA